MTRPARSRRAFLRLLAAGYAAAMARPAAAAEDSGTAADRQRRARPGEAATRSALPEEIEKQKKSTAESVERLRAYALPPGSPPAYVFRPLARRRTARRRG